MNEDRLRGRWKQVRGEIQRRKGKLTDDEFDEIAGQRDKLVGRIQGRYGEQREVVAKDVDRILDAASKRAFH